MNRTGNQCKRTPPWCRQLRPAIAAARATQSTIHGDANVPVFPDLNSGNIGYKLVRHFAGATAVGPIVTGLNASFMDVAYGCFARL